MLPRAQTTHQDRVTIGWLPWVVGQSTDTAAGLTPDRDAIGRDAFQRPHRPRWRLIISDGTRIGDGRTVYTK